MKMPIELDVTDELCKNLLTTCYEGGSGYWLACEQVERDDDLNVIKIAGCYDREDATEKWGDATLDTVRTGIQRLLEGTVQVNASKVQRLRQAVADPDNCQWDADDADCVLQAGLLNDIVYG